MGRIKYKNNRIKFDIWNKVRMDFNEVSRQLGKMLREKFFEKKKEFSTEEILFLSNYELLKMHKHSSMRIQTHAGRA